MGCPQCRSEEIGPSGTCLVCGFQINAEPPAAASPADNKEGSGVSGIIAIDYSASPQDASSKEELPQWRQELSQRLQAIKQKREVLSAPVHVEPDHIVEPPRAAAKAVVPQPAPPGPAGRPAAGKPSSSPSRPAGAGEEKSKISQFPRPRQKTLQPLEPAPSSLSAPRKTADAKEVQSLIDNVVARQVKAASPAVPRISFSAPDRPPGREGKLILLSRTLSGLIDLICIVVCAGAFVIAADFFSGIVFLDSLSMASYAALFLLTYFLYSIFFLAASGQTIGMMITDLRVAGSGEKRPSLPRLLGRCLGYLLSLSVLGFGLLWSLFDGESICFHDRISNTRVIRIHNSWVI